MQFPSSLPPSQSSGAPESAKKKVSQSANFVPKDQNRASASIQERHIVKKIEPASIKKEEGWLGSFASIAHSVGQGAYTIAKACLVPTLEIVGRTGYDLATIFMHLQQQKSLPEAISLAVATHLQKETVIQPELEKRRQALNQLTGSTACQEIMSKMAARIVTKLAIEIATASGTPQGERSKFQTKIVKESQDGLNLAGSILSYLLANRFELVQSLVEANLLTAVHNIICYVQEQQAKNPYFFVELVHQVLEQTTIELRKLHPKKESLSSEEEKAMIGLLVKNLVHKLREIAYPQKANDILSPVEADLLTSLFMSKESIFEEFEQKILPDILVTSYFSHDGERKKDEIVLNALRAFREAIDQGTLIGPSSRRAQTADLRRYPHQEAFIKSLGTTFSVLFSFFFERTTVSKASNESVNPLVKKLAKVSGPIIINWLLKFNFLDTVNQSATFARSMLHKEEENPPIPRKPHEEVKQEITAEFQLLRSRYSQVRKGLKKALKGYADLPTELSSARQLVQNIPKVLRSGILAVGVAVVNTVAKHPSFKRSYKQAVQNVEEAYKRTSAKESMSSLLIATDHFSKKSK